MVKVFYLGLFICGALMLLLGLISGGASLLALVERHRSGGPGIMFADVEFFGLLALVSCTVGAFSLIVAKRIARHLQRLEGEREKN